VGNILDYFGRRTCMYGRDGEVTMIPFEEAKALRETNPFDPRNVRDQFKGRSNEDIKSELDKDRSEMVLCLSNEIRDMNLSSCIRSANSFNIDHVVMAGRRNYDRRGAVGSQNYIDVQHREDMLSVLLEYTMSGPDPYRLVALEYDERYPMTELSEYEWSPRTLLVTGEEGRSVPDWILNCAVPNGKDGMITADIVYIPMMGTVRSLNLASAVSIALYDYTTKVAK